MRTWWVWYPSACSFVMNSTVRKQWSTQMPDWRAFQRGSTDYGLVSCWMQQSDRSLPPTRNNPPNLDFSVLTLVVSSRHLQTLDRWMSPYNEALNLLLCLTSDRTWNSTFHHPNKLTVWFAASIWEIAPLPSKPGVGTPCSLVSQIVKVNSTGWGCWKKCHYSKFHKTIPYSLLCQISGWPAIHLPQPCPLSSSGNYFVLCTAV
jgi:hypothetical protein